MVFFLVSLVSPAALADEPASKPGTRPHGANELVVTGKLYCPLKRYVTIPHHGVLTELKVETGQKVGAGDIIGRYDLAPEVSLDLHKRLLELDLQDFNLRIAELTSHITTLDRKKKEIETLVKSRMAPRESLKQVDQERRSLIRQRDLLRERIKSRQNLYQKDRSLIESGLGLEIKPGAVPVEGVLKAPIDGYVIYINPEVRVGAEFPPHSRILEIGIMDPLTLRVLVHQIEMAGIQRGDQARFVVESMPDHPFPATVSRIPWTPADKQLEQPSYFELEFLVPNPDLILREGFRGKVYITPHKPS